MIDLKKITIKTKIELYMALAAQINGDLCF